MQIVLSTQYHESCWIISNSLPQNVILGLTMVCITIKSPQWHNVKLLEYGNCSLRKHSKEKPCKGKPTHPRTHGYNSWSTQPTQGDQSKLMQ